MGLPSSSVNWGTTVSTSRCWSKSYTLAGVSLGLSRLRSPKQPHVLPLATSSETDMASPQEFAQQYGPQAAAVGKAIGVDPSVLLGQWGLETGWGRSVVPGTNNLGNIKDFAGGGVAAVDNMTGSNDRYRAYDTPDAFGQDFAGLINRRYQSAINAGTDAQAYARALKAGGYAEDPDYERKLVAATDLVRRSGGFLDRAAQAILPSAQAAPAPDFAGKVKIAKEAGYSDADIIGHLSRNSGFADRIKRAREAGYSDSEIYQHLGLTAPAAAPAATGATETRGADGVLKLSMAQEEPVVTAPSEGRGGLAGGAFMGAVRDPLDAGAQMLVRGVRAASGLIPDALGGETARRFMDEQVADVDRQVRTANQEYAQSRELAGRDGFDAARLAGNVVSPANIPVARLM
ncbi:hypothetical protein BMR85_009610, partial [Achromobacter sp. KAs 3-5]